MINKPKFYDISYISTEEISRFKDEKRIDDRQYLSKVLSNDDGSISKIRINICANLGNKNYSINKVSSNLANHYIYGDCTKVIDWIKSDNI